MPAYVFVSYRWGPVSNDASLLDFAVTIGGVPAAVQYAGGVPGQIAGLMQINVQIPNGVAAGGYVPVIVRIGDGSTPPDAAWIAISEN